MYVVRILIIQNFLKQEIALTASGFNKQQHVYWIQFHLYICSLPMRRFSNVYTLPTDNANKGCMYSCVNFIKRGSVFELFLEIKQM